MDSDRRTRFLVSPVLFVASLLLGAWFDDPERVRCFFIGLLSNDHEIGVSLAKVAAGLAASGLVVFVTGYVIGTLTNVVLSLAVKLLNWVTRCRFAGTHEIRLKHDVLKTLWSKLKSNINFDQEWSRHELSAGVVLDHGILQTDHPGVHGWLVRRWNAVSIAATSVTGLISSVIVGHCWLGFSYSLSWTIPVGIFAVLLAVTGFQAWRETMRMLEFMTSLPAKRQEDDTLQVWLRHR